MSVNILKESLRLPGEYQEVEYIEGDGSQYFSNVTLNRTLTGNLTVGFKITAHSNATAMYLSTINADNTNIITRGQAFSIGYIYTNDKLYVRWDQYTNVYSPIPFVQDAIIEETYSHAIDDKITEYSLFSHTSAFDRYSWNGRCYYYWLKIDDEYVFNYVPCYRKSDGEIGMYDTVSETFVTNQGTGTFLKGNDVVNYTVQNCKISLMTQSIPNAYQPVEYIQATGTQYIGAGVTVEKTEAWECDIDMQFTSNIADMWAGSNGYLQFDYSYINTLNRASIKIEYNPTSTDYIESVYVNGTLTKTKDWSSYWGSTVKFGIFRLGDNNDSWHSGTLQLAKLFSQKLYKDGVLVRNFIPCYRKSDNEIGLYDTVSGTFFTNEGTGTFLKGNDIFSTQKCGINLLTSNPNAHNLPNTYQEVEYIESTGTQYIDTGVSGGSSGGFEFGFLPTFDNVGYQMYLAGDNNTTGKIPKVYNGENGSNKVYISAYTISYNFDYSSYITNNEFINLKFEDNKLYLEGQEVQTYSVGGFGELTFWLFNSHSEPNLKSACKVNYLKMYKDGELIRNFIPCYRKSDDEIGLYDLVNNEFYTNAGTGTFIKGNNIKNYNIIKI